MEQLLRAELRTSTLRAFGSPGAGGISEGRAYDTDAGPVFVKVNHRAQVRGLERGKALEGAGERAGRGEKGGGGRSGGARGGGGARGSKVAPSWARPGVTAQGRPAALELTRACRAGSSISCGIRVSSAAERFRVLIFFACLRSFRLLGLTSSPVKHGGRGLGVLGCFRRWP